MMSGFNEDKDRKVIPRWRKFDRTKLLVELSSSESSLNRRRVTRDFLAQKVTDWRRNKTVAHASDLVGAAVSLRREQEATEAARFLLSDDLSSPVWARDLARRALTSGDSGAKENPPSEVNQETLQEQVRSLRRLLRFEPNNPISWVDLSHCYACLGNRDKATQSMTVALQLAKSNRFVIRSASRLWVHLDDPERAHEVILRSEATRHDPWLVAAEVAVGSIANEKPKLAKEAQRMLSKSQYAAAHTSELASALATLEFSHGNIKKSKKLFKMSLEDPTENSVAQAAWASRQDKTIPFDDQGLKIPNVFEANSWKSYLDSNWNSAVEQCKLWLFDQPFSARPSLLGSYIASVAIEDFGTSKWFLLEGLRANRNNVALLNNLAYTYANQNDYAEAKLCLSRAQQLSPSDQESIALQATQGLLAFRTGEPERGRELYSDACQRAKSLEGRNSGEIYALATTFHAIEECALGTQESRTMIDMAVNEIKGFADPIHKVLEQRMLDMVAN